MIFVSDPEFGRAAQVMLKDAAALERAASSLNETDVGTLRCVTVLIRPSLTCFQVCVCVTTRKQVNQSALGSVLCCLPVHFAPAKEMVANLDGKQGQMLTGLKSL